MLTIRPADVNTVRAIITWSLRAVAISLVSIGAYLTLKKVLFGIGTSQPNMIIDVYEGVGEGHSLYRGLSMLAVGLTLGALSSRLARWAIVVPTDACPGCGYTIDRPHAPCPCPECGLPEVTSTTPSK